MNDKVPKQPAEIDIDAIDAETKDLPPLDGDEVEKANAEELASYITVVEDVDESFAEGDGNALSEDEGFERDLCDFGESSWVDDGEKISDIDMDPLIDDDEEIWADRSGDEKSEPDMSWFVDELEESPADEDDGGAVGAGDEAFANLDEQSLGELASLDEDDEETERKIEDVMAELGIHLPIGSAEELEPAPQVSRGHVLESQFLGPVRGTVTAAVVVNGEPIAVGDGLFLLGADGMLHGTSGSKPFGDWLATAVCAHDKTVFVGTQTGGAYATGDQGVSFEPINGWSTLDFSNSSRDSSQRVSTSFCLSGQETQQGFRLLGRTGEGQAFYSLDNGRSWTGLMTPWPCLALAPVHGTFGLVALLDSSTGASLVRSDDLVNWHELAAPDNFINSASRGMVSIGASAETLVLGIDDPLAPLFCSLDGGRQWKQIKALRGVTAVAPDLENPGWMAAAAYQESRDLGVVRVTEDGGVSWQTVLITGESAPERELSSSKADSEPINRVCDLIIDIRRNRQIFAVTRGGIYKVVLANRGVSH